MKFASRLLIVGAAFAVMFAIGCSSAEPTATPIPAYGNRGAATYSDGCSYGSSSS